MPKLYHTLPGHDFDVNKSEVLNWLIQQPEVLSFLFSRIPKAKDYKNPAMKYDAGTGLWCGVDFEE